MYKEPHLNKKNDECSKLWHEWFKSFSNKEKRFTKQTQDARIKWCNCVDELSEQIHQEYLENYQRDG